MFVQVIQGRIDDPGQLRAAMDRWREELEPGADGWLGFTGGVTDDGTVVMVARFESAEAARRNSDRPEQGAWWASLAEHLDDVSFTDYEDVRLLKDGGSDDAGFVQIIRGRVDDPSRLKAMMTTDTTQLHEMRPEILGGTLAIEADGSFVETIAFTSEDEARRGEQVEPPADVRSELDYAMQGATYYDLHRPWFESA
jgi:hypothetical protein